MAKDKFTTNDDNKYHNSDNVEDTFKASEKSVEEIYKASEKIGENSVEFDMEDSDMEDPVKSDTVTLTFKKNRTKELHVNKKIYRFNGPQSIDVPREVIEHSDFVNQRKYFLVKGE
jgi:hypothetical protein